MKSITIKCHIDKKIKKNISDLGYDGMRQDLFNICIKFHNNICKNYDIENHDFTEENINSIKDTRCRYLASYIYYAQKRITDLYEIENKFYKKYGIEKSFNILLLKEKILYNYIVS